MKYVNTVIVTPENVTLKVGEWYYSATGNAYPETADCRCVTWSSDNSNVASVNATNGYILARSPGTTRIYATATDGSGCRDYITVTVSERVLVDTVSISGSIAVIEKGDCITLSATAYPTNADDRSITWSSSNPSVATVSQDGVVHALSVGDTAIFATANDGSGKRADCAVHVTENILVTSVCVYPEEITMPLGRSTYLHATVCPENATYKTVKWTSSDTEIVSVNQDSGLILAEGAGCAQVYATACDGSGCVGCCYITVRCSGSTTDTILANSVNINKTQITLEKGVLYELPITPNYTYKGYNGAQRIPGLTVSISPSNATQQKVWWWEQYGNVLECLYGWDDDDDRYIHVRALETGTSKLYAQDWAENGTRDECTVMVETQYEKQLRTLGGFSNEEINLILKLYDSVEAAFPSESMIQKAWRSARLLSEFSYDSFSFNDVAGSLTNEETRQSYFTNSLGYTENEYNTLKNELIDNHNGTNVIDFTHFQYSLAARLAYTLDEDGWASNLGSQFKTGNWGIYSDEDISYLGGWLGDATLRNDGGTGVPILKNDDYMADLDAENIYRLILQGNSSVDAINSYYSNMNVSNTRADIFLQHIPYSTVKQKIFYELIDADLYVFMTNASNQGDIYMTRYWLNLINDEQYHFDEIKSRYPDTYDFLMSLNDRLLTMAHYE